MALSETDKGKLAPIVAKALFFAFGVPVGLYLIAWLWPDIAGNRRLSADDALVGSVVWLVLCGSWYVISFGRAFAQVLARRTREDFLCIEVCSLLAESISLRHAFAELGIFFDNGRFLHLEEKKRELEGKLDAAMIRYPDVALLFGYKWKTSEDTVYTVHIEAAPPEKRTAISFSIEHMDNLSARLSRALLVLLQRGEESVATVMQNAPDHYMRSVDELRKEMEKSRPASTARGSAAEPPPS